MSSAAEPNVSAPTEAIHVVALGAAALGLLMGLVAQKALWVNMGVSLLLLLPPLRLATTIIAEARARRFGIAGMGILVLALLLFSRRIS